MRWILTAAASAAVLFIGLFPANGQAIEDVLNATTLVKFSPRARADLVIVIERERGAFTDHGIVNGRRLYHFLATIAAETGGMVRLDENMSYSPDRAVKIFGRHLGRDAPERAAAARRLSGDEVGLANQVYGARLGNRGRDTMDGWDYRGSGFIQLTGRSNFIARRETVRNAVGGDIVTNPDLVRQPRPGLFAALSFWKSVGANDVADEGNSSATVKKLRRIINGGENGLEHAILWHAKARKVFGPLIEDNLEASGVLTAAKIDEKLALQSLLGDLGYTIDALEAIPSDESISNALREFQDDAGIGLSGTLNDETFYRLVDPQDIVRQD